MLGEYELPYHVRAYLNGFFFFFDLIAQRVNEAGKLERLNLSENYFGTFFV